VALQHCPLPRAFRLALLPQPLYAWHVRAWMLALQLAVRIRPSAGDRQRGDDGGSRITDLIRGLPHSAFGSHL